MARRDIVAAIDIGTSNVRVIVGEIVTDRTVNIVGVGTSPSEGLRKGVIIDLDRTVESIARATAEAERMVGSKIEEMSVGISGSNIGLIHNRGVVAVSGDDKEITELDVERVLQAARVIALPPDREIVDVIPREYIVDGYDGIRDPVGMLGVRLEVEAMIITGSMTSLRNLLRCLNVSGYEISALVLNALANGEVCLSRDEKELGAFLIDLGGGTTELALFKEGALRDIAVLPVGGDHITNDMAVGLRTTFQMAESVKTEYGLALAENLDEGQKIEIQGISGKDKRVITLQDLSTYIEPRIQEIMQLCKDEMVKMGYREMPPGGVILTGGVSLMQGITELAESYFGCSVRAAQPDYLGVKSPIYSTAVGIIHYMVRNQGSGGQHRQSEGKSGVISRLWKKLKTFVVDLWE